MNIINYVKEHSNDDFKTLPFSEVDNLILSLLPYLNFTDIVPSFNGKKITLKEAASKLKEKEYNYRGIFNHNTYKLLQVMANSKRYSDALLYNYMKVLNNEMQFGALTIKLNDNSKYISYAGTDTSIVGWEEDFKMAYMYPGASQKYATVYLNKAIGLLDKNVRVGGHSKGGNLAISAVMNAKFYIRKKVKQIYNNDGPGFLKEQVESVPYKKIQDKIKMYVPEHSIIGMILYHQKEYTVVKSKGFNIIQHDAFNWVCNNKAFILDNQSKRSKNLEFKLTKKLEDLPIEKRINLVKNIFDIFKNNNIKDIKDIDLKNFWLIIKSFKELDKEAQNILGELLLILFIK